MLPLRPLPTYVGDISDTLSDICSAHQAACRSRLRTHWHDATSRGNYETGDANDWGKYLGFARLMLAEFDPRDARNVTCAGTSVLELRVLVERARPGSHDSGNFCCKAPAAPGRLISHLSLAIMPGFTNSQPAASPSNVQHDAHLPKGCSNARNGAGTDCERNESAQPGGPQRGEMSLNLECTGGCQCNIQIWPFDLCQGKILFPLLGTHHLPSLEDAIRLRSRLMRLIADPIDLIPAAPPIRDCESASPVTVGSIHAVRRSNSSSRDARMFLLRARRHGSG